MQIFKTVLFLFFLCLAMASFSQCTSSKQTQEPILQNKGPIPIGKSYFQAWVAGIQGGGSGINVHIPKPKTDVKPDSIFFRGMKSKLNKDNFGYVAQFKTQANQKDDVIMSNEPQQEYGNTLNEEKNFPFQLKENECVVSYLENNTIKYFKIQNLIEKPMQQYPSAPPRH